MYTQVFETQRYTIYNKESTSNWFMKVIGVIIGFYMLESINNILINLLIILLVEV